MQAVSSEVVKRPVEVQWNSKIFQGSEAWDLWTLKTSYELVQNSSDLQEKKWKKFLLK